MPGIAARGGGPAQNLFAAIPHLAPLGWSTTVYATDAGGPAGAKNHLLSEADLPAGADSAVIRTFPMRPPKRLAYSPSLAKALDEDVARFDLIRIHSLFLHPQFAAGVAARRHQVPYIVSLHGALDPWMRTRGRVRKAVTDRIWGTRLLEAAAAIHVATEREAELTSDVAPSVPRRVVPNGVDVAAFAHQPDVAKFKNRFLGGHEGPIVMFLGRIAAKKNIDTLIRSMPHVLAVRPDALLAIVGPDDEGLTPMLQALSAEQGVSHAIRFIGPLYGEDRIAALHAAKVWALASHTENFGSAVIEAMAAGVPVVVSPGVNLAPEIASAGGGLVAAPEPEPIGAAIIQVLSSDSEWSQISARARLFAERFDWKHVAPQMAEMYASVA